MAKIKKIAPARFLGANIPNPKVLGSKVEEIIDVVNTLTSGTETFAQHITDTTQSTTTATGALIVDGGVGIVKNLNVGGILTVTGKLITTGGAKKPVGTTVAAGALITAAMILSGYVEVTGTTNSSALDSAANLTTALGTSPAGTMFDFTLNTIGTVPMTAGNILTITAGAGTTFMKQVSNGDTAVAFLATTTATAGVHLSTFRVTYDTATTIVVQRIG